jgi:hypothetical protein
MTNFLAGLGIFLIGYYIGKRVGIALAMMRMEAIIADLQRIQSFLTEGKKQWNEDQL